MADVYRSRDEMPPAALAASERNYMDIKNAVDHLVVLLRQLQERHPDDVEFDLAARMNWSILHRWPVPTVWREVLSAAVIKLVATGYEPGPRPAIEGIVDPFADATEPLDPPSGSENTPEA